MWSAGPLTAEKYASLCGNGVEVELTYPRKQAYCGKNCRMDQRILLDGLQDNPRYRPECYAQRIQIRTDVYVDSGKLFRAGELWGASKTSGNRNRCFGLG